MVLRVVNVFTALAIQDKKFIRSIVLCGNERKKNTRMFERKSID